MAKTKLKSASDFWLKLDQYDYEESSVFSKSTNLIQLSSYQRAISNFVRIVTGNNIPVTFTTSKHSYTDGTNVVVSSNVDDENFDPVVGLALHEASHIKLTDFKVAKFDALNKLVVKQYPELFSLLMNKYHKNAPSYVNQPVSYPLYDIIFTLINYVEDRRIDNFIYTEAPGYRAYYHSLYDTYFNSKIIDKGIRSKKKRTEEWDSYLFRIINITNPNRDLNALKGLKEVWSILDLSNISRLQSTLDSIDVAIKIFMAVETHLDKTETEEEEKKEASQSDNTDAADESVDATGQGQGEEQPEEVDVKKSKKKNKDELTLKEEGSLEKAIKEQGSFIRGAVKKKKISNADKQKVDSLTASEIDIKDCVTPIGTIPCMIIKKFNQSLVDSYVFEFLSNHKPSAETAQQYILDGVRLGTMLGKKLKLRSETRDTVFNRQQHGTIDKRMLSGLGYGVENIFSRIETSRYNPGILHISLDLSSSMNGSKKFTKAMTSIVAIAKACSMIDNLDCVISLRTTHQNNDTYPVMCIAYDSRVDSFTKITSLFKYIRPAGLTPEGICFQAIMNSILESSVGKDSYFINFSDGEPCFSNRSTTHRSQYDGETGAQHTATQVRKMKNAGIRVLSYFIGSGYSDETRSMKLFRTMYGSDSEYVDVNNLLELTRTLNNNFLKK